MHSLFDAEGALMGKPLFETHRFGDRRTVVRRFKKGEQVHFLAHHGTEADRATVFNVECDVKVTEEFTQIFQGRAEWRVVQLHTDPGSVVDASAPRETRAAASTPHYGVPIVELHRPSWWSRFWAWFWT